MKKRVIYKISVGITVISLAIITMFYGFKYNNEEKLSGLGYTEDQVEEIIEEHGILDGYSHIEKKLKDEIKEKESIFTNQVGDELSTVKNSKDMTLVKYSNMLDDKITERTEFYNTEISTLNKSLESYILSEEDIIDYTDYTLAAEYNKKVELINKYKTYYEEKVTELKQALLDSGVSEWEVNSLITGDNVSDVAILEAKKVYIDEYNSLVSTSGNSYAPGAMDLFNRLNAHRTSKGLAPFRYNAEGQSCVDIEANSYANNKNPHNWLCKELTSEGSSLASSSSDYIKIAGDFLTSHDSHERDVIAPEYVSAACSAVQRDNMVYMICGYFTY